MEFHAIRSVFFAILFCCVPFMIPKTMRFFRGMKNYRPLPVSEEKARFAVIIPARNESKVIGANLCAIENSDYPEDKYEIYVIVESRDDPTVQICAGYQNVRCVLRKRLSDVGKGYALDECIRDIFRENDTFDAFLILDADNVIGKKFLSGMNDAYQAGYDAACGNRNNKDWNASLVSSASALTFTALNSVLNKPKSACGLNVTMSGTGFFVRADRLRALGGWPFHSLTEDYEFSTYALCNGLKTCYVENAMYYDEQPLTMRQSIVQRTRWVKGFFSVCYRYHKNKKEAVRKDRSLLSKKDFVGGLPVLVAVFDLLGYLCCLVGFVAHGLWMRDGTVRFYLSRLGTVLLVVYIAIALFTVCLFRVNGKYIRITKRNEVNTILFHPVFLASYVIVAIRALFVRSSWEVVEHSINMENSDFEEDILL